MEMETTDLGFPNVQGCGYYVGWPAKPSTFFEQIPQIDDPHLMMDGPRKTFKSPIFPTDAHDET